DRGLVYLLMGRYEEALADFSHAIEIDEKDDWYRFLQALAYLLTDRKSDFEWALQGAIELVQATLLKTPNDWRINFNLALYKLVAGYVEAEALYNQLASTCSSVPALQEAIDDLDELLMMQPFQQL